MLIASPPLGGGGGGSCGFCSSIRSSASAMPAQMPP